MCILQCILLLLPIFQSCYGQYRSPEIIENPTDLLVAREEPATLNCHADGKPEPEISWYKDGAPFKLKPGRHLLLRKGDLFFLRVLHNKNEDDTGVYWCVAENSVGKVRSNNATLEIAVLRDTFRTEPKDVRVAVGETALLECLPPRGHPEPVVTWTRNQEEIDPATIHRYKIVDQGSLVITGVRVADSGEYVCKARNVYGTRETKPASLTVLVSPHLVSSSGTVTGTAGSTVELVCRVGGDPSPEVFWYRLDSRQLPIERMTLEENSQVLRIRHVAPEDRGIYSCSAENPVGTVKANISLNIHSRPVISVTPLDGRVGVNGTISFECESSGSPSPTSYWTHEGTGVILGAGQSWGDGRVSVDAHNTLTIHGVTREDKGYYVCTAVGVAGSALARAHLEVQGVTDMPPPIIALGSPNQTLPVNTEGEMPCEARGTPEPSIKWFRNDDPINPKGRVSITPMGTLRIKKLQISDSDNYICKATSETGTTIWKAYLKVAKPTNPNVAFHKLQSESALPHPPEQVTVMSVNSTSIVLGWRRGRPGLSSILGHTIQMWSPDIRGHWKTANIQPMGSSAMPVSVIVKDLQPDTRYIFAVRASNRHGLSRPSPITHSIRTLSSDPGNVLPLHEIRTRLSSTSVKLYNVESLSSSALKLSWNLLVDAKLLEGVYVRYHLLTYEKQSKNALISETVLLHSSSGPPATTHTVSGLSPASTYELFIVPFFRSVEGQPSTAIRATTLEAPPKVAPNGLHYNVINSTAAQITWDPIPEHAANGRITGYNLKLVEVTNNGKVHLDVTINNTWTVIGDLMPGSAYHATLRGVTASGSGPLSKPLAFTMPASSGINQDSTELNVSSSDSLNNTYYMIAIGIGAVITFVVLLIVVFVIYKRRHSNKCPQYFSKATEGNGPWSEYPGCWGDTSVTGMGVTGTLYRDVGNPNISQMYSHTIQTKADKSENGYEVRPNEDLYEDPDGLKLVSFTEAQEGRCISTEPYATTPLITGDLFRGSNSLRLPPNIPVSTGNDANEAVDSNKHMGIADYGGSHTGSFRSHNFNTYSDKGSLSGPVLQFPPPPAPSAGEIDTNTLNSMGIYSHSPSAKLLLQQLPYSMASSSSGASQMSHGSPMPSQRNGRCTLKAPPSPLAGNMNGYRDYETKLQMQRGFPPDMYDTTILQQPDQQHLYHHLQLQRNKDLISDPSKQDLKNEIEWYNQPLLNNGHSPQSSVLGDVDESDSEYSSGGTSSSAQHPLSMAQNMNWADALRAAEEARWGRDSSFCSTDDSTYVGQPSPILSGRPPRQPSYKKAMKIQPHHDGIDLHTSVTSPLV